jgi:hypothetical protein
MLPEADADHGVEDGFIRDAVADEEDLVIEARLQAVDVLSPPQPRHDHWRADVDQERPGEAAGELLHHAGLPSFQFSPQGVEVAVDLILRNLPLLRSVNGYLHSQVLDRLPSLHSRNIFRLFGSEDLRLLLVQAEIVGGF